MSGYPKKVLVGTDYGPQWSSGEPTRERRKFLSEYQPIIDMLELDSDALYNEPVLKEAQEKFAADFARMFPADARWPPTVYHDLRVVVVEGPYIVCEYDGAEYVLEKNEVEWL